MSEKKPGFFKRIFSFALGGGAKEVLEETASAEAVESRPALEAAREPVAEGGQAAVESRKQEQEPVSVAADEPVVEELPEPKPEVEAEAKSPSTEQEPATSVRTNTKEAAASAEPIPTETARKPRPEGKPKKPGKLAPEPEAGAPADRSVLPKEKAKPTPRPVPETSPKPVVATNIETAPAIEASAQEKRQSEPQPRPGGKIAIGEIRKRDAAPTPAEPTRAGWFKRLRSGLSRSSEALAGNIAAVFVKKRLDEDSLQDLEDILIQADLGIETAMRVTEALSAQRYGKDITDREVREIMAAEIEKTLAPVALPLELDLDRRPHVILVVGVNGSGKTTTIGKLTAKLSRAGLSTLLVAGDTFRAAAIEQLKIWGERTDTPVIAREIGADAAALAFDAYARAKAEDRDVVLMDTAGRLQNKTELMAELEKIIRVLRKQDPEAPHTVLLTLDATTGQNAMNQVEIFRNVAGVNGLVMTKLDGTARGGIIVAISAKYGLPVYFVGVGEQVDDLEPFEANDFARSISGLEVEAQPVESS